MKEPSYDPASVEITLNGVRLEPERLEPLGVVYDRSGLPLGPDNRHERRRRAALERRALRKKRG